MRDYAAALVAVRGIGPQRHLRDRLRIGSQVAETDIDVLRIRPVAARAIQILDVGRVHIHVARRGSGAALAGHKGDAVLIRIRGTSAKHAVRAADIDQGIPAAGGETRQLLAGQGRRLGGGIPAVELA